MMKAKHTSGPWRILVTDDEDGVSLRFDGVVVTTPHKKDMANARLVAAAPDLLAAAHTAIDTLRAIVDQGSLKNVAHLQDGGAALRTACYESIVIIRNAIAKAFGIDKAEGTS